MQQVQTYRTSIIVAVAAATILASTGLASAQASSSERLVNEGPAAQVAQVTSVPVPSVHGYRSALWLRDMVPDQTADTGNDEFIDGDIVFYSIFWAAYVPIAIGVLLLIGDWLMRRFRKLRASFHVFNPTPVHAELRFARSNRAPRGRG
jgi:hypothetical protein